MVAQLLTRSLQPTVTWEALPDDDVLPEYLQGCHHTAIAPETR